MHNETVAEWLSKDALRDAGDRLVELRFRLGKSIQPQLPWTGGQP